MSRSGTLAMSFVVFFAIGLLGSALGPALPDLADQTGSDLAALGALFTASFAGTMIAQMLTGPFSDRLGQRPVLLSGVFLLIVGTLAILLSRSLWLTLGVAVVFGLGFGALDVGVNVLIARVFAHRGVSVLNLLHVFFGVGAVTGPTLASASLRLWDTALPVLWSGIIALAIAVPFILRLPSRSSAASRDMLPPGPRTAFSYRVPLLWALGVLLMVYVGLETGMGAWTTAYVDQSTSVSEEAAALVTSGFWLALTAGRLAGAAWGSRLTPYALLWGSLAASLVGGLLLVLGTGSVLLTISAVLVIGFFFGPPYPTMIAITTAAFPDGPGKAASVVAALGSVGGMLVPWMQGVALDRGGGSANALFVAAGMLVMLLAYGGVRLLRKPRAPRYAPESP